MVIAPKLAIPVPLMVVGFLTIESVNPFKSRAAPLSTVTVPLAEPRAEVLPSFKVPADIKVGPPYAFVPDNVHVPVPVFVIPCEFVVKAPAILPVPVPPIVKI